VSELKRQRAASSVLLLDALQLLEETKEENNALKRKLELLQPAQHQRTEEEKEVERGAICDFIEAAQYTDVQTNANFFAHTEEEDSRRGSDRDRDRDEHFRLMQLSHNLQQVCL